MIVRRRHAWGWPLVQRQPTLCARLCGLLAAFVLATAGCADERAVPASAAAGSGTAGGDAHVVHVVRRGWHSGIALDRGAALKTGLLPEADDFPGAAYIEIGWGDRQYYMADSPGAWLALRAALGPTDAVLHVEPRAAIRGADAGEAVALPLDHEAFLRLVTAVAETFDRTANGLGTPVASHLSAGGRFYPAHGSFHLLNTCNTWTARALAAAGLAVDPSGVVGADTLMRRVRAIPGARIAPRRRQRRGPQRPKRRREIAGTPIL